MADTTRFREGAGRLSLDFLRTLRYRGTDGAVEELPDGAALAAWVAQCGPCATVSTVSSGDAGDAGDAGTPGDAGDVLAAEARELREAVYVLLQAARGGSCDAPARELVNRAALGAVPVPYLDADGNLSWRADGTVAATLSVVARDALELAASDLASRIRECADPTCRVMFLDTSRPGARRWCSMGTCGNRAKKQALRARR